MDPNDDTPDVNVAVLDPTKIRKVNIYYFLETNWLSGIEMFEEKDINIIVGICDNGASVHTVLLHEGERIVGYRSFAHE